MATIDAQYEPSVRTPARTPGVDGVSGRWFDGPVNRVQVYLNLVASVVIAGCAGPGASGPGESGPGESGPGESGPATGPVSGPAAAPTLGPASAPVTYPLARTGDVVDDYHGTPVPDPYRWLEDAKSEETLAFVTAQNRLTRNYLDGPKREAVKARLAELYDAPRYFALEWKGRFGFFRYNPGLSPQPQLMVIEKDQAEPRVLLDPNKWSEKGTVALTGYWPSPKGRYLAYATSTDGSDNQTIHVWDVENNVALPDKLEHCRFASVAWLPNESGFYYPRFPSETEVADDQGVNQNPRVHRHTLQKPQSDDPVVYTNPERPNAALFVQITADGRYLVVSDVVGSSKNGVVVLPLRARKKSPIRVVPDPDHAMEFVGKVGRQFYFVTDRDAPRRRLIALNLRRYKPSQWRSVIAEQEDVLQEAQLVGRRLVTTWLKDVTSRLRVYDLKGRLQKEVDLPGVGTLAALNGEPDQSVFTAVYTDFLSPSVVLEGDATTATVKERFRSKTAFDHTQFTTRQVFYTSKDGTRVPMFLLHRKDLPPGPRPTILYGYGGFNVSITPRFSLRPLPWLEEGNVYAIANLRGGGEYGAPWHAAGTLERKQNVFDDFIAAAEYLVDQKLTSTDKLTIFGGSNGGLLTLACMLQRPKLFGAVVSAVPVADMLRFHKFTAGRYWTTDYGNAEENPEHFKFLYAYSPIHNVEADQPYPPLLVLTADTDDRVVPMHGKKFIAAIQAKNPDRYPLLLRVETQAGHGGGKPVDKQISEIADLYAFIDRALEL